MCPAVQYGFLYTKAFEREKFLALSKSDNNYDADMSIPSYLKSDFEWWHRIFSNPSQVNSIRSGKFVCEIFTDASLTGWGAFCGIHKTHGWWSEKEKNDNINILELRAVFYGLKCFAYNLKKL